MNLEAISKTLNQPFAPVGTDETVSGQSVLDAFLKGASVQDLSAQYGEWTDTIEDVLRAALSAKEQAIEIEEIPSVKDCRNISCPTNGKRHVPNHKRCVFCSAHCQKIWIVMCERLIPMGAEICNSSLTRAAEKELNNALFAFVIDDTTFNDADWIEAI